MTGGEVGGALGGELVAYDPISTVPFACMNIVLILLLVCSIFLFFWMHSIA